MQNKIENRKISAQLYKNALNSLLDLLQSQEEVLKCRFEETRLQYKKIIATIQLVKALGGGYCNEEIPFQ